MKLKRELILFSILSALSFCNLQTRKEETNIIFISMDTTRFDYIDIGNQAKARTPAIKSFAKDSIVFTKAFVTIPQTLPSHLSIFTSRYPHELKVTQNHSRYNGNYRMVQEILRKNGYKTYGIISLMSLIEPGFWKGFDEFNSQSCSQEINHLFLSADKVYKEAKKKLAELKNNKFFMFVHFSDPHYPYGPPSEKKKFSISMNEKIIGRLNPYLGSILPKMKLKAGKHQFRFEMAEDFSDFSGLGIIELTPSIKVISKSKTLEFRKDIFAGCHFLTGNSGWMNVECQNEEWIHLQILPQLKIPAAQAMYQKEIEFMDHYIGLFLQQIAQHKLLKKTIIAIFSDHGEGLGEREEYVGHGEYLNQQFIRVPLLIFTPKRAHRIIEKPVSLTGLSSTILDCLNLKEDSFQHSFLNLIKNEDSKKEKVLSFAYQPSAQSNKVSIIHWPYQGIFCWENDTQTKEIFNLNQKESFSSIDQISLKSPTPTEKQFILFFLNHSLELKKKINTLKFGKKNIDRIKLEKLKGLGYIH